MHRCEICLIAETASKYCSRCEGDVSFLATATATVKPPRAPSRLETLARERATTRAHARKIERAADTLATLTGEPGAWATATPALVRADATVRANLDERATVLDERLAARLAYLDERAAKLRANALAARDRAGR
jgi:hypothetical protein